jgi:hypothetical protein
MVMDAYKLKISVSLIVTLVIALCILGAYYDFGTGFQTYLIASATGSFSLAVLVSATLFSKAILQGPTYTGKSSQNTYPLKAWFALAAGLVVFGSLFYYYFSQPYRVVNTGKHIYHAWAFGLMFGALFLGFLQILVVLLYRYIKK